MSKKSVVLLSVVLLLMFGILGFAGCQKSAKKPMEPQAPAPNSNMETNASERRIMANKFSKQAETVNGVQKASVIVYDMPAETNQQQQNMNNQQNQPAQQAGGLMVIVGLTLANQNDAAQAQAIENTVSEQIKSSDPNVKSVMVTRSPELIQKIDTIANGIVGGRPVNDFKQDIDELAQKIKQKV